VLLENQGRMGSAYVLALILLIGISFLSLPALADVARVEVMQSQDGYVAPGEYPILFSIHIKRPWYIHGTHACQSGLFPTSLTLEGPEGIEIKRIAFPPPQEKTFSFAKDPVAVYSGNFTVRATLTIEKETPVGRHEIKGAFASQACSEKSCLPPETVPISFRVSVVPPGEKITHLNQAVFEKQTLSPARNGQVPLTEGQMLAGKFSAGRGGNLCFRCRLKAGLRAAVNGKVLDLPEFDITNEKQLHDAVSSASVIINCAAYTNVDGAESRTELAYAVNAEAVGRIGNFVRDNNAWVLHISTDFVFDGTLDRPYNEEDTPNPINKYGMTKLAGEQLLNQSGCRHCIVRIEWTYGRAGNNFPKKLITRTQTDKVLNVVDDQIGSPTATTEVAATICQLLPSEPEGIYHFANDGYVSRYDMAKFIVDTLGIDVELNPCKTSDYVCPAARPLNSRFDCSAIKNVLDTPVKHWQEALRDFLLD